MWVDFDARHKQEMDFFTAGTVIWIMHSCCQKWHFKLKCLNDVFVSYKHTAFSFTRLTDGLECDCGLLWCFISCLDSHSDGTHSLQRIHWWSSDGMLNFSKSVSMKNQTHLLYILDSLRASRFSAVFIFGWTIPLKVKFVIFHCWNAFSVTVGKPFVGWLPEECNTVALWCSSQYSFWSSIPTWQLVNPVEVEDLWGAVQTETHSSV